MDLVIAPTFEDTKRMRPGMHALIGPTKTCRNRGTLKISLISAVKLCLINE